MKKILCTLLTIAMLFSMVAIPVMATTEESTVIGYDPTISTAARTENAANVAAATEITADTAYDANVTYYKISTAEGLAQFAVLMRTNTFEGKTVYLTADIDMLGVAYSSAPTTAVSAYTAVTAFKGTFDGQGYVISNLHITNASPAFGTTYAVGFFTRVIDATLKNIVFNTNCVIESGHRAGAQWVGGLAATITGTTLVSNVYMGASVSGMQKVGGFYGMMDANATTKVTFEHCTNAGAVAAGSGSAGGFAGHVNLLNTFNYCRNIGTVVNYSTNADDGIGGFIGRTNGNQTQIAAFNNCINSGSIKNILSTYAGGFVGKLRMNNDYATFTESYNYGEVASKSGAVANLINTTTQQGGTSSKITVSNTGADAATAGTNTVTTGAIAALTAPAYTYNPATVGYSEALVAKKDLAGMKNILNYSASAADTAYVIDTPAGLVKLAEIVNGGDKLAGKTIYLGADINMTNISGFAPIGNTTATPFGGIFDGQGHVIDNLTVTGSGDHIGLFGVINEATVKNLVVGAGCTFTTNANADHKHVGTIGALHGALCEVSNIYSAATVKVTNVKEICAGGIVGGNFDSYNNSSVSMSDGSKQNHHYIANCTFNGTVNGGYLAGGILGTMNTSGQAVVLNSVYVLNCHSNATTTIQASGWSSGLCTQGGIVGLMDNYGQLVINNAIVNEGIGEGKTSGTVVGSVNNTTPMIPIVNATVYNQTKGVIGNGTNAVAVSNYTVSTAEAPTVTTPASAFPAAMVHGYQKSTATYANGDKTCISVRVVGSIDSSKYSEVGFKIRVLSTKNTATPQDLGTYETTTVYTSLNAQNETGIGTVTVASIRDSESAFYAVTIQNLSTTLGEIVLEVIPYAIAGDGETEILGTAGIYTIDCSTAANVGGSNVDQG